MKSIVSTDKAPRPAGHYSQATKAGDFVYVSGQGPLNPQGQVVPGDVREQTRLVLSNIRAILEAAGAGLQDVVRCGVFLGDIGDFAAMNEVYRDFFGPNPPARTTVGASLPGIKVEIDAVAYIGSPPGA